MKKIYIMGVGLNKLSFEEFEKIILKVLKNKRKAVVYTPNTEIVMKCSKDNELKRIINEGDYVLPDGIGLIIGSKLGGHPIKERIAGYDVSMRLIEIAAEKNYTIFFLGGEPGVAEKAAKKINDEYGKTIVSGHNNGYFKGVHTGYPGSEEENNLVNKINSLDPDIIFVGLGSPNQERWINYYRNKLQYKIIIGNGGTMDVISGKVSRAPELFIKMGLEWLYRLITDPVRIKRQWVLPVFIIKMILFGKKLVRENEVEEK